MSWEIVKLKEVIDIKNGRDHKKVNNPNGKFPIYGSGGIMGFANDYLCDGKATIIGRKGSINNPFFVEGKFWNVDTAFALVSKSNIHPKFFYYFCTAYNFEKHNKATTLPSLTKSDLLEIEIPLPPLATQKRIAEILDAADALRRKDQELLKKYDELAQAIFIDMFGDPVRNEKGWEVKRIGEVCRLQGGFSFKSNDITQEGIRLVKISNVHFEKIDWTDVEFLPNHFLEKYKAFTLNENDICIALTRPIIKSLDSVKVIMARKQDLPCLLNQRVGRFILNSNWINNTFFIHLLYSKYFKDKIEKLSSTSLQPNVGTNQIEDILIPIPSIEDQLLFERRIKSAQKMKYLTTDKKTNLLFDSLIQKAFTGELVA
jgi:type I restriction enzyme S subunit